MKVKKKLLENYLEIIMGTSYDIRKLNKIMDDIGNPPVEVTGLDLRKISRRVLEAI